MYPNAELSFNTTRTLSRFRRNEGRAFLTGVTCLFLFASDWRVVRGELNLFLLAEKLIGGGLHGQRVRLAVQGRFVLLFKLTGLLLIGYVRRILRFALGKGWVFNRRRREKGDVADVDAWGLLSVEGLVTLCGGLCSVDLSVALLRIVLVETHFVKNYEIKNKIKIISCHHL